MKARFIRLCFASEGYLSFTARGFITRLPTDFRSTLFLELNAFDLLFHN